MSFSGGLSACRPVRKAGGGSSASCLREPLNFDQRAIEANRLIFRVVQLSSDFWSSDFSGVTSITS